MKLFKSIYFWLVLILVLSLGLRIFNINSNPPALYGDELTMVYDAYSIGLTGRAQTGEFLPFTMTLSDHRPPGYVYLDIPFAVILGPTPLAARLPSVLAGVGLSLLFFLIGRKVFSPKVGLLAALTVAILPWDISLSRAAYESHLALFLTVLGIYFYLKALEKPWWMVSSVLVFGAAFNTYSTYKLFIPMVVGLLIVTTGVKKLMNKKLRSWPMIIAGFVGLIWLATFVFQAANGSEGRLQQVRIFNPNNENQVVDQVNKERLWAITSTETAELFHNKYLGYGRIFSQKYLELFSPNFLIFEGDGNPRHNMFASGPILLVGLGLLIMGGLYMWSRQRRWWWFFGGLLLLAPIPSALTGEVHYLRSSLMILPLVFLMAAGMGYIFDWSRGQVFGRVLVMGIGVIVVVQMLLLIESLFVIYPQRTEAFWSVSAMQVSQRAMDQRREYDVIVLVDTIDNIEFAYPVYAKVTPEVAIEQHQQRTLLNGKPFKKFDNVYIGPVSKAEVADLLVKTPGKVLVVAPGSYEGLLSGGTIYYSKDNQPVLVEYHN